MNNIFVFLEIFIKEANKVIIGGLSNQESSATGEETSSTAEV